MKEYTLLALVSVCVTLIADNLSGVKICKRKEFYFFLLVIFIFKLLVNGYLTRNIVLYNPKFFYGIRLGTIPAEDFLFGFSMVTTTLIIWEYFKK